MMIKEKSIATGPSNCCANPCSHCCRAAPGSRGAHSSAFRGRVRRNRSTFRSFLDLANYRADGNVGRATLLTDPQPLTGGAARVRVSTLDAFELPACDFLKIDVEGFEASVVNGAERTIRAHRPVIYTENDRKAQQGALIDLLAGLDYRLYWHVAPLFRPDNHNRRLENVFGNAVALNMLCFPKEKTASISGFDEIDPSNWTSPISV